MGLTVCPTAVVAAPVEVVWENSYNGNAIPSGPMSR